MGVTIVVNYMTASHKGSSGMSIAFPDVCKTPILGVPVPIPYPNIAKSSDLADGSKDVEFDGESVVLKSSNLKRSMGDEVGVQKGLLSNEQMGKAEFLNYSFDVKVEGQNVCRLADPTSQNMSSLNAAAFFHIQEPAAAPAEGAALINDACDKVKSKIAKEKEPGATQGGPDTSGIIPPHWHGMVRALKEYPHWVLYWRKTSAECSKWIYRNFQPKAHEHLDCLGLRKDRAALIEATRGWLITHSASDEANQAVADHFVKRDAARQVQPSAGLEEFHGLSAKTSETDKGKPIIGKGAWEGGGVKLTFDGKWLTSDYDIYDVLLHGCQCQRPTEAQFGYLKYILNQAMKWPGVQHPHQTAWNTALDPGFDSSLEDFSVQEELDKWMKNLSRTADLGVGEGGRFIPSYKQRVQKQLAEEARKTIPVKDVAEGRKLPLIDTKLTVMASDGGLSLPNAEDYWAALVCSGCLDEDKPSAERTEFSDAKERSKKPVLAKKRPPKPPEPAPGR